MDTLSISKCWLLIKHSTLYVNPLVGSITSHMAEQLQPDNILQSESYLIPRPPHFIFTASVGPVRLQLPDHVQGGHGRNARGARRPVGGGPPVPRALSGARREAAMDRIGAAQAQLLQGTRIHNVYMFVRC